MLKASQEEILEVGNILKSGLIQFKKLSEFSKVSLSTIYKIRDHNPENGELSLYKCAIQDIKNAIKNTITVQIDD